MAEINELAKALNEFQAELVTVGKEADNPFFKSKYAELGAILKRAQPVLTKHGLSVIQLPDNIEGQPALTTILLHTSGQSLKATVPLTLPKQDPQGFGSAMTYYRRYGYASALQIVIDEDDDGNKASESSNFYAEIKPTKANSSGHATQKQREFVAELLEQNGIEPEDQKGYLIETLGLEVPLTFEGASFAIEQLKKTVTQTVGA